MHQKVCSELKMDMSYGESVGLEWEVRHTRDNWIMFMIERHALTDALLFLHSFNNLYLTDH